MRPRELFVLCSIVCVGLATGILMLGEETHAGIEPEGFTATTAPITDVAEPAPPAPVAEQGTVEVPRPAVARDTTAETVGWTSGTIRGDIQLAVSVMDKLTTISVVVEEQRSMIGADNTFVRPTRIQMPVERGIGTPTFEVRNVPFSEYPYVVSVLAPGLNGGRRVLTVDPQHALVDNVVLTITPGTPFSVLVRDQDAMPYPGIDVRMLPVGDPLGRGKHAGKTNNFGSVLFDCVLAGDYQVMFSVDGQAITETQTITVQPGSRTVVQGQSHAVTIARGVPVQVEVADRSGYAIADVKVTATAKDRIKLTALELNTNGIGRCLYSHLQPGEWQLTIEKAGFERKDLPLTVQSGVEPDLIRVVLVPTR